MENGISLYTERLLLRQFLSSDAPVVQQLLNDREIAANTLNIPHPFENGMAEEWIANLQKASERGGMLCFAITIRSSGVLIGAIALSLNKKDSNGELASWIGKSYWNQGFCTEGLKEVIKYGFRTLMLHKIYAECFSRNQTAIHIIKKLGLRYEGCMREHVEKWGVYEDLEVYSILRYEYSL